MADLSKFEEWKSIYKKPERYDPLTKWLDPTEIEFKTILKIVDFKDKTVLDVGAGTGRLTIPISEIAKKVCAIEPHEDMINYMEKKVVEIDNIEVKRASAEDIPYPDDFFDVVICSWVIQHFKDFKKKRADAVCVYCAGCLAEFTTNKKLYFKKLKVYHIIELVQMAIGENPNLTNRAKKKRGRHFFWGIIKNQFPKILSKKKFRIAEITEDPPSYKEAW